MSHRHISTYLALMSLVLMLDVVPVLLAATVFVARYEGRRDANG